MNSEQARWNPCVGIAGQPSTGSAVATLAVGRREAAKLLGISERLLWTWTHSGHVPHVRLGSRVLYPIELLRRWLEEKARISKS